MEAAHTSAPPSASSTPLMEEGQTASSVLAQDTHLRRCLVTGELLQKSELLRFVVGPDQALYPDLARNLPGRGLWVTATREAITLAAKKNLFAKAAKTSVVLSADLADQVADLLQKRCLDLIGLARRTGAAVLGQVQVEAELKSGQLDLLLLALDASGDLSSYRSMKNLHTSHCFTRQELGAALGHEQLVYVGFKPHAITNKLQSELKQLEKINQPHHRDRAKG